MLTPDCTTTHCSSPSAMLYRIPAQVIFFHHVLLSTPSASSGDFHLLRLLGRLLSRRRVQPQRHKCQPPNYRNPYATNPNPRTANLPTPRPLVVRKMSNCDLPLFFNVGKEGAVVLDVEVEDTVLIRGPEGGSKDS